MRFIDLFAGLGGFHCALARLGHECVFASEIDPELRCLYSKNFPDTAKLVHGDIRECSGLVPTHEILAAGFPCQPFSKSGKQDGRRDKMRGTLFDEILAILDARHPKYVLLENVGNFERHDGGRTWKIVESSLRDRGYHVTGTTHVATGGHGLVSPHHLGFPQHRERFYIVASTAALPPDPFPKADRSRITDLSTIVDRRAALSDTDRRETSLTPRQIDCIEHWNAFVKAIPIDLDLPSFPIWGDEFGARYPYSTTTPRSAALRRLRATVPHKRRFHNPSRAQLLSLLPSYAVRDEAEFPAWKIRFIAQNRRFYHDVYPYLPHDWKRRLHEFPPSLRKLEWNCSGEERDLWSCVLQFRPSGLRAKRFTCVPALVAMTTTQIPILGPERRFLTRREGLRLQGFPCGHLLPDSRQRAFAALGNAVHVDVVQAIARELLSGRARNSKTEIAQRHGNTTCC